jgi:hypothetical protein
VNQRRLLVPRLVRGEPADPGMVSHPVAEGLLAGTEGEPASATDPAQLDVEFLAQQAAQGQPPAARRASCPTPTADGSGITSVRRASAGGS